MPGLLVTTLDRPPAGGTAPGVLSDEATFRAEYGARMRQALRAPNTHRAYNSDRMHFEAWCDERGITALPAGEQTLIGYLLYWGDPAATRHSDDVLLSPVTLARRISGLKAWHAATMQPWPQYRSGEDNLIAYTLDYIARAQKATPVRARALSLNKLDAAARALPITPLGRRNKAILLTGFYGAFRRSELISLDLADVTFDDDHDDGMILHLRASKTDQKGCGRYVPINYQASDTCPMMAVKQWLQIRGQRPGPLFTNIGGSRNGNRAARLSPGAITHIVKNAVHAIGEDSSTYSAHSLRSGFVTTAAKKGVPVRLIRQQTGHASYEMLDRYIHTTANLTDNATRYLR